jgi:lipoate-protein ligase A
MQEYVGYYENGLFHSAGKVLKIPQKKIMKIFVEEPVEEIKTMLFKTPEERMASWKRLQELCIDVPADFDEKKALAKARNKKYGYIDVEIERVN